MKSCMLFCLQLVVALAGCTSHRPYTAMSYEPVTVKQKGDFSANISFRPFSYYNLNATYAINNFMAVRVGNGGYINLTTFDGSLIFFHNHPRVGIFAAATYNYQRNLMERDLNPGMPISRVDYKYNCEYHSPGFVLGANLTRKEGFEHQLIFKTTYNSVIKYYYRL